MIPSLPQPKHERLPHAPLELVIWQLQFSESADVVAPSVGDALRGAFATPEFGNLQLSRLSAPTFVLGAGSMTAPPVPEPDGWQLRRNHLAITVGRAGVAIESKAYDTWSTLRSLIETLVVTLSELGEFPGEQRVGLRYIDRITHPGVSAPADWKGLLGDWLMAPITNEGFGSKVLGTSGQLDVQASDEIQATIRHHSFADADQRGRQTVVLDIDAFRVGYRPFESAAILAASDQLSDVAHQLFESSVSPVLYEYFATEESPA